MDKRILHISRYNPEGVPYIYYFYIATTNIYYIFIIFFKKGFKIREKNNLCIERFTYSL